MKWGIGAVENCKIFFSFAKCALILFLNLQVQSFFFQGSKSMNCHLPWNLTHQKPSWNWIKLLKEVVDKILSIKRQVKPFVKTIYVTMLLFHYINVCNPNHPWRIWSKLVLLYFACNVCMKVFFFKKPKMPKWLLFVTYQTMFVHLMFIGILLLTMYGFWFLN
jgi:hypothetical protein